MLALASQPATHSWAQHPLDLGGSTATAQDQWLVWVRTAWAQRCPQNLTHIRLYCDHSGHVCLAQHVHCTKTLQS